MIMAADKMTRTSRKGGAVVHLSMSSDTPSLCGRMAYGTGNGKRLCKTCARIARVDLSSQVSNWSDLDRWFITLPREAGQWQMLQDVVDDYARCGVGSNDPKRIALYQAALAHRNTATTVITNNSDASMIRSNGNGFGSKTARVPGATENQRNALRKMAAFVDSLFSQLFELQGKEISESDPTTLSAMTDEWFNNLTRTEIDKQFKTLSALIERLKGECSRTLTDPESIANGIGPVCASNMGW